MKNTFFSFSFFFFFLRGNRKGQVIYKKVFTVYEVVGNYFDYKSFSLASLSDQDLLVFSAALKNFRRCALARSGYNDGQLPYRFICNTLA